jgi:hypothetical protein
MDTNNRNLYLHSCFALTIAPIALAAERGASSEHRTSTGDGELGCRGFSWGAGPPHATIPPCPEHCAGRFGAGHFLHCTPLCSIILRQRSGLHRFHRNDPLFSTALMAPFFGRCAHSTAACLHNTHHASNVIETHASHQPHFPDSH